MLRCKKCLRVLQPTDDFIELAKGEYWCDPCVDDLRDTSLAHDRAWGTRQPDKGRRRNTSFNPPFSKQRSKSE